uniref:Uncharacterized protein n=1 Tax=Lutzomyia longipalpis TaxID=7200 RepID=A0A1B0CLZ6_LUTLO
MTTHYPYGYGQRFSRHGDENFEAPIQYQRVRGILLTLHSLHGVLFAPQNAILERLSRLILPLTSIESRQIFQCCRNCWGIHFSRTHPCSVLPEGRLLPVALLILLPFLRNLPNNLVLLINWPKFPLMCPRENLLVQRISFMVLPLLEVATGQIVLRLCHIQIIWPQTCLVDLQCALIVQLHFVVFALHARAKFVT